MLGNGNYAGAILDNGVFVESASSPQIISGAVSGSGELIAQGTLTLAGSNSYTGGTIVTNNGTLAITGAGALEVTRYQQDRL